MEVEEQSEGGAPGGALVSREHHGSMVKAHFRHIVKKD